MLVSPPSLALGVLSTLSASSLLLAAADEQPPVVVGQTFLARNVDPSDDSAPWAWTSHGVAQKCFTVDEQGEIVGQVAQSVTKVSEYVWDLTIKSGYKFSDGTTVDASHVAWALAEQNAKNSNAQSSLGNITVTTPNGSGNLMVRIESERPTHVMDAVLAEWAFVVYYKNAAGDFIFTGPYMVDNFVEGEQIDLVPNPYYTDASERPARIQIKQFSDGHHLADGVKNHEVDVGFHLPIDTLSDLRNTKGVTIRSFEVGYHYMMFYNLDTLTDLRVRQAIDLAIDRTALSQELAGGKATRSLFPDNSPFFEDKSDPHSDPDAASDLLDQAGWTLNANNRREKNGQELTVRLVAYPHRPGLGIMQPVIADSLRGLGIVVTTTLTGQVWNETQQILNDRTFDLMMWAQHTLPAGDPLWFLSAFFRSSGGKNHANLQSATVDARLDALALAENHGERILLAQAAMKAILDEQAVSNLVTPYWHVGLSDRVKDFYEPWGSDYYVIRDDFRAANVTANSGAANLGLSMQSSWMISAFSLVVVLVGGWIH